MATLRLWGCRAAAACTLLLALVAGTAEPQAPDFESLASMPPEARLTALTSALAAPSPPEEAGLRLWKARTLLDLDRPAEAAAALGPVRFEGHPLAEFAWKWRSDALASDPSAQPERERLLESLLAAPGEPSFRREAARTLADLRLEGRRWSEALPPLEVLLRIDPLDAPVAASLADAAEKAGNTDRARELAAWLYTEMPAHNATLEFFRASPDRRSWVASLPPARVLRRLLRADATGALDILAAELPSWRPASPADSAWRPYFQARLDERAGRAAQAIRAYLSLRDPVDVAQAALARVAPALPAAGLPRREFEEAVKSLERIGTPPARERAFLTLFRWRLKQADPSGASYFARKALSRDSSGSEAAEYLYHTSWEHRLAGLRTAADGLLRDLSAALPPSNEYRQASLFTLLLTGGLEEPDAAAARQELLSTSRYGYFGYQLRGGQPPAPATAPDRLPPAPPPTPGSHRAKAQALAAWAFHTPAAEEFSLAINSGSPAWQHWELALQRSRAADYPSAVSAARRAFPESFGEGGDRLAPEVWRVLYPLPYREALERAASESGLSGALLAAVARQESLWDRQVVSKAGAVGLLQLLPATARQVARQHGLAPPDRLLLCEPSWNLPAGAHYLRALLDRSRQDLPRALASYNAGPGNADRWAARPGNPLDERLFTESIPFRETRLYVRRVTLNRWEYDRLYPGLAAPLGPASTGRGGG